MISLANVFAGQYSQALQQRHSTFAEAEAVKTDDQGRTTYVRASASSTSESTYFSRGQRSPALTYGPTGEVDQTAAVKPAAEKTQAASTILSFIELQLTRDVQDGATAEELQSRLEAGLQGFIKGYTEAAEQLAAAGFLNGDVKTAIEKTYSDVLSGVSEMAEKFGLQDPVEKIESGKPMGEEQPAEVVAQAPKNPIAETLDRSPERLKALLDASAISHTVSQTRSFSFELKTQDGDTVTIKAFSRYSSEFAAANYRSDEGNGYYRQQVAVSQKSSSADDFFFEVEGELDEGEIKAINDLLSKVNDIAETFYNGNLDKAFEQALNIGYDTDEIAKFALNLKQQYSEQVASAYGAVAQLGQEKDQLESGTSQEENRILLLRDLVQQLEAARETAEQMGIGRQAFSDLTNYFSEYHFAARDHEEDESRSVFSPYVAQVLDSLVELGSQSA
ncbi:DUF5610 domain-containing protein [Teredinibacter sp. KSP-S5-2]|uniref:DUF5610 domain-containing protein n=1 Tax=Teredinibacter sp. KSP-S5-2 TaxID=3034506 RepID=UPI002934E527|nr:DUF5610 domain-containing protein [Teredinibacter sp. KSP-S5-2]WNO11211.1 DUF5610 domain-containing protein [Teredinibacter sp. KSP-S5-2]